MDEINFADLRPFTLQHDCETIPWNGDGPKEIVLRLVMGAKQADWRMTPVTWEYLSSMRELVPGYAGLPTLFAFRPHDPNDVGPVVPVSGWLELFPIPDTDFSAGFAV